MTGTAQLFMKYESQARTFYDFASELQTEFGNKQNSAVTHEKPRNRRKRRNETMTEYLFSMLALAAEGDVDLQAVLTYTVQGFPGPSSAKFFMLEAENLREFKKKLAAYDSQQQMFYDPMKAQRTSHEYLAQLPPSEEHHTKPNEKEEDHPRINIIRPENLIKM